MTAEHALGSPGSAAGPGSLQRVTLAEFMPLPEGERQYPLEYIEANAAIKLREDDRGVLVGVCDPFDAAVLSCLEGFHEKPVSFRAIERSELSAYLGKRLAAQEAGDAGGPSDEERLLLDRLANDAPIVNLVNSLLIEAIRRGASDVHIEGFAEEARVRYRIDGALRTVSRIGRAQFPAVSSRIKIMANLNIMERRLPQDGRLSVHLGEGAFDIRVSIVPIASGESIVLRIFNAAGSVLGLEDLGIEGPVLSLLRNLASRPHGLLLATGPTGSGKTTTLNALLREIASESVKIVTIEDPVEYRIDGVDQIQTNDRIGLTFESLLRRVLRQDPDIIMVGEIRDAPTAELSVRAALTGHLVLSTLHTNDAVSVIPRLRNIGVEPYLLAAVLRGAMAQRLVRRICRACREETVPGLGEAELLRRHGVPAERLFRGKGCEACGGTGFAGRTSIVEAFASDAALEGMILKGEPASSMERYLASVGFTTLVRYGLGKAAEGITTVDEVIKAAVS
jgi:type II secretory ATPase GspE/PulE/Tfp pilus assembly ATPase PilB-like protein